MNDIEQAIAKLKQEQQNGDVQVAHINADAILCELLLALGHSEVVEEFSKVEKWYA